MAAGLLCVGAAGLANAADNWTGYNTTVGRLNGSGYTGGQAKAISGADAGLRSKNVGGDYVVDARVQTTGGKQSGPWSRNIGDNTNRDLDNSIPRGASARVQFSNNWNTPVNVQVSGTWRAR